MEATTASESAADSAAADAASQLSRCLGLLPVSLYLSSEQRQQLNRLGSGGGIRRLRFDPDFADPAKVLTALGKLNQVSKKKQKKLKTDSTVSHSSSVVEPVMKLATQQQPSKSEKAAATRQELQQKLQSRMEQLRQQRNAQPTASGDRGKKRRSLKRKEATLKRRVQNLAAANETQPNQQQQKQQSGSQAKYNKDGKILYSKFDLVAKEELLGSETTGSRAAAETRKRQRKQLERRLVPTTAGADLERQRRRIEAMKSSNPEAAARLEEKARWERAMARAEGVKVKDDPARLARTAKRQAKMRRVKARKWQERQAGVEQRQTERQERRRANIRARGEARVKRKIERAKKKGRILPELHGK